jgi:hypothetical protein
MSALAVSTVPTRLKGSLGCAHLHRCLAEADFKYNHRIALGIDDTQRAAALLRGAKDKRLLYRQPDAMSAS